MRARKPKRSVVETISMAEAIASLQKQLAEEKKKRALDQNYKLRTVGRFLMCPVMIVGTEDQARQFEKAMHDALFLEGTP